MRRTTVVLSSRRILKLKENKFVQTKITNIVKCRGRYWNSFPLTWNSVENMSWLETERKKPRSPWNQTFLNINIKALLLFLAPNTTFHFPVTWEHYLGTFFSTTVLSFFPSFFFHSFVKKITGYRDTK